MPLPSKKQRPEPAPLSGDDLASLIYTSGTTGDPKGVMLTHRNFMSQVNTIKPLFPITERDISMSFLPLSHVYERTVDYVFLSYGVQINYVESIERVPMQLTEIRPTIMVSVPRLYERSYIKIISKIQAEGGAKKRLFEWGLRVGRQVREAVWRGEKASPFARGQYAVAKARIFSKVMERLGGRLRFTISGGAPLAREVAEFFDIVGLPILQGYGLTETSPVIAACRLEFNRLGSVGTLIPGVEVRIAPDGEILARGANIMKGYWRKPEATAEAIDADGWFHTGDVGYLDADGCLYITDRKKDIIVTSGGKNIAPQPIEGRLGATPYIAQAVVIGDKYPYLTALVVPNFENLEAHFAEKGIKGLDRAGMAEHAETNALVAEAVKKINGELGMHERIRRFTVLKREFSLEDGEMTPTMKVRRRVVGERYRDVIEGMYLKTQRAGEYELGE
jgi:long-chain acyl-CoA synthetase